MHERSYIILAGLFGMSGVILGAFGAHALKETLAGAGSTAVWQTAVDYQMWHALALLVLAALPMAQKLRLPAACFAVGILLFSGSLYWLALGGPKWLGPVTPLGGLSLILGWAFLVVAAWRGREDAAA